MSIFADDVVHEFEYQGYTFGIKEIPYGKSVQINKKAMAMNLMTKQPDIDIALLQEEKIKAGLVYIKNDSEEIQVTLDVIRRMKESVANKILEELDKLNEVDEKEKKN
jgi:hypothetical protein